MEGVKIERYFLNFYDIEQTIQMPEGARILDVAAHWDVEEWDYIGITVIALVVHERPMIDYRFALRTVTKDDASGLAGADYIGHVYAAPHHKSATYDPNNPLCIFLRN